uniref:Uncharacterized protein n=1 Tax=Klebsiella pneumoniae TaxID=573 RepID=A0A8B0SVB7_KLEPN|nr:hypothetical protein [Klebsiella pneumoniae]
MFSKVHQRIHDMGKKNVAVSGWCVFEFSFVNPCLKKYWQGISEYFIHAHQDTNKNNDHQPLIITGSYFQLTGNAYQTGYKRLNHLQHSESSRVFLSVNMQHTGV